MPFSIRPNRRFPVHWKIRTLKQAMMQELITGRTRLI
jgi:hypothetical protein